MLAVRNRKRILFMAEAATLAHVARPYALARSLDPQEWEVVFACADAYLHLFPEMPWPREPLASLAPQTFMSRLANGERLYSLAELNGYAEEDLRLLKAVQPDVVVGDFRLSLSASARVAGVPYVALTNAYWSPYVQRRGYPMPCLPLARFVGVPLASALFAVARPAAFAWHALPLNQLRRHFGLPSLGLDLRRVYTDADMTLYADVPELVPTAARPANHRYIGPVEWSPAIAMPQLPERPAHRPLVYVSMGSSGAAHLLPSIVAAFAELDCHVAVAAAGAPIAHVPANATIVDYLPGAEVSAQASLVVCNGGSPTSLQALAHGVPVLGLPCNLDQHLNMGHVAAYGAGLSLRPEAVTEKAVRAAAVSLLEVPAYKARAVELASAIQRCRPHDAFAQALRRAAR